MPGVRSLRSRAAPPAPRSLDPVRGATLPLSGRESGGERLRAACPSASTGARTQRKEKAARRPRLENSRPPAPRAAARGAGVRGRPPPLGPAVVAAAAARLGAHPGPSPARARAEAGEARQHPLARPRAEQNQPSRGAARCTVSPRAALAAPGPRALQAPGGGRRPSLSAVTALSASASGLGGVGSAGVRRPDPDPGRRGGESWRGLGGRTLRHRQRAACDCCVEAGNGRQQEGWANQRLPPAGPGSTDKSRGRALLQVRRARGIPGAPSSAAASFRARAREGGG